MEASIVIPMWQLIIYLVGFTFSYAVIVFMTKQNVIEIKYIKENYVLHELYKNEVDHLNNTLKEIKALNTKILEKLTSKSN